MYATYEEADAYVRAYYSSTSSLRIAWEQLSDEDKQVLLNRAEQTIDMMPLQGYPTRPPKAFPRYPNEANSMEAVKTATIELAVQGQNEEAQTRFELQRQGVMSYTIGDLSETFGGKSDAGIDSFAVSIVLPYLRPWLGGGYRICRPCMLRRR